MNDSKLTVRKLVISVIALLLVRMPQRPASATIDKWLLANLSQGAMERLRMRMCPVKALP